VVESWAEAAVARAAAERMAENFIVDITYSKERRRKKNFLKECGEYNLVARNN
jgi:hypothetical protein